MRLGIKGKQVLGVTSIVGVVVVIAERPAPGAAGARQPRREPRARGAARERHLSPRAGGRRRPAPIRYAGAAGRLRPAVDPRIEPLLQERHVRGDRRRRTGRPSSHADPSREGAGAAGGRRSQRRCSTRSPFAQLLAIYSGQGQNLEFAQPLLLGDTDFGSIRIGVSTLLIRQDLNALARARRS